MPRDDRLLSARDAQRYIGVPMGYVRVWYAQRQQTGLHPKGHDALREPLFLESELRTLHEGRSLLDRDDE